MWKDDGCVDVAGMHDLEGCQVILQAMPNQQCLCCDMLQDGLLHVGQTLGHIFQGLGTDAREAGVVICDGVIGHAELVHQHLQQ